MPSVELPDTTHHLLSKISREMEKSGADVIYLALSNLASAIGIPETVECESESPSSSLLGNSVAMSVSQSSDPDRQNRIENLAQVENALAELEGTPVGQLSDYERRRQNVKIEMLERKRQNLAASLRQVPVEPLPSGPTDRERSVMFQAQLRRQAEGLERQRQEEKVRERQETKQRR